MRKLLQALGALGVLTAASVLPSIPAQADDSGVCSNPPQSGDTSIHSVTPSPTEVVVGLRKPVTQTFTVVVTDSCPIDVDVSNLTSYDGTDWQDPVTVTFGQGTKSGDTWTFLGTLTWDPATMPNGYAGEWTPATYAYGSGYDGSYAGTFSVEHATRLGAKASVTQVRAGKPVTISGLLRAADWEHQAWAGLAGENVALERKGPGSTWAPVGTAATGTTGQAALTVRPTKSGCYRLVFGGADGHARSTSSPTYVKVKPAT